MHDKGKSVLSFAGYPIFKDESKIILTKDELNFIKDTDKRSHLLDDVTNIRLSTSSNILENIELKRLKDIIWNSFCYYAENVLEVENQFYICTSWSTIQKKGDFHPSHIHPNAIFSTVLYAQAEKGTLSFQVNRSIIQRGFFFEYKVKNYNEFNAQNWQLPVKTGDLVTFPGELRHESLVHECDSDRAIIGASFFIEGNLGQEKRYNTISIKNNREK